MMLVLQCEKGREVTWKEITLVQRGGNAVGAVYIHKLLYSEQSCIDSV